MAWKGRERERQNGEKQQREREKRNVKMEELKGFFAEGKRKGVKEVKAISAVSHR